MALGAFIAGYALGRHHGDSDGRRLNASERTWQDYQERQELFEEQIEAIDRLTRHRDDSRHPWE